MKKLTVLCATVLIASLLVSLVVGCQHQTEPTPPAPEPPPPVEVSPEPSPPPSSPSTTPTQLTMLSITDGRVFVMRAGTNNWVEAQVGLTLELGDKIKAGSNSRAEITFFEGSTIELDSDTMIEVADLDIATDTGSTTILIKQEIGKTISRVEKLADPASRYEVESPAGVVAVRGSIVITYVGKDGLTFVCNVRGNIWAIAQGVELQIPKGVCGMMIPGRAPVLQSPQGGDGEGGSDGGGGECVGGGDVGS